MYYHRAWADIDLEALSHNLCQIRAWLPAGTEIMAVVKADAYGHGALAVARHLQGEEGLWGFGVGDSHEALELRNGKISAPILILGAIIEDEIGSVLDNDISVCVHSSKRVARLDREAMRHNRRLKVHLMVDTGMGRLGVSPERAIQVARGIAVAPGLEFAGLATHYASTNNTGDLFTLFQLERFKKVAGDLDREGIEVAVRHASNSTAVFSDLPQHFNVVRPGISLYGIGACHIAEARDRLKPVLSLRTQVVFMKDVAAGTPVGYNRTYVTPKATRIATIPIGYNDGYSYRLSSKGRVLIRGQSAPVVGAVSMDYTMVDIGHIPGVEVGERVTVIGRDGDRRITVEELARIAETIPYEITCSIGKRVRRVAGKIPRDEASRKRQEVVPEPERSVPET